MSEFTLSALTSDLKTEEGLRHAILQSLHNWQASENNTDNGWWSEGIGTQDWQLAREKQTPATLKKAQRYTKEALQWLVDKNIAQDVAVQCEFIDSRLNRLVTVTLSNREYQFSM